METLLTAVLMGVLGGPAMAWAITTKKPMQRYEKEKQKFLSGQGKNPDRHAFGPHKSFKHNAIRFGMMMAAVGAAISLMGPS